MHNVANAAGHVRVTLCTEGEWLTRRGSIAASAAASPGCVAITLADVPPGTYGVMAHHDMNDDGIINRDMLGRPTEGIGFSLDAPMIFGPPRFKDAAVSFQGGHLVLDVSLRFGPKLRRRGG